ncbi:MAG: HYR domain-containing protein [Verrucomicrobia bacterium]|nr:HYR domain-containing protein [Verrucomicrobiota bacterium]
MKPRCLILLLFAVALFATLPAAAQSALEIVTVVPAAANTTVPDEDGDYPAYIDIKAFTSITLSGLFLTDAAATPTKWQIPAGYSLKANETLRIFASGKDRKPTGPGGQLHMSFTYDCSVPFCGLYRLGVITPDPVLVDSFADRIDRCACNGLVLLQQSAIARTLIPDKDIGDDWTKVGFNDTTWLRGPTGVGYDDARNPLLDNLVLHHTMNTADRSATTVIDTSGPTLHHGTINGTVRNPTGLILQGFDYAGTANPANHVVVKNHTELDPGTGDFSVSIWFNSDRGPGAAGVTFTEYFVSKLGGGGRVPTGWALWRTQDDTFVHAIAQSGASYRLALGRTAANQWHHLALVINRAAGQVFGYLNGKRVGAVRLAAGAAETFGTTADLYEGRDNAGNAPLLGTLDDLGIWNRALADSEIAAIHDAGNKGQSFSDPGAIPGTGQLYGALIGTDVLTKMRGVNASAYVRVPFNLSAFPSQASGLRLRMQYDDGLLIFLNGAKVAERRAPTTGATWNSKAASDRPDASALAGEVIDLSAYRGLLRQGLNVLAFHALNSDVNAERFLVLPTQLCLEQTRVPADEPCIKDTNGRDFWVAFPENYVQEPDAPLSLSLCIAGPPETIGAIEIPGLKLRGFPVAFAIPGSGTVTINIPIAAELKGKDSLEKKGVHIVALNDVAVYATTRMDYTTDTYLALPTECLGTEYLVMSYQNVHDNVPLLNGTQFAVLAISDFTEVTITPRMAVGSHAANVPYKILLHRGQTYQLRDEANKPADLTGTLITSTKPVAVFGSHRCANVQSSNQFFCDVVVEELLPVAGWGTVFYVAPLATRASDTVRILSSEIKNNITVTTSSGASAFVLDRAEWKDIVLDSPARIVCRRPSLVAHFSNSSDADHVIKSDPFMALVQPFDSWLMRYRLCTPPEDEFELNYVNVIAQTTPGLNSIRVNGTALGALPPGTVTTGAFATGEAFARVRLNPGGSYLIDSFFVGAAGTTSVPFGLTAYGFSEFDSYGYPGGMQSDDILPPLISCPQELTIHCEKPSAACTVDCPDLIALSEFFDNCTSAAALKITQTPRAGEVLTVGAYMVVISATDANGNTATCTTKLNVEPMWEEQQFGASTVANPALEATVWGAGADPDADGVPNAVEQTVGTDPNRQDNVLDVVRLSFAEEDGEQFLKVSYRRPAFGAAGQIVLEGRASLDEDSPWLTGPDLFEELSTERALLPDGEYEEVSVKVIETLGARVRPSYFLRLRLLQ